jgi:hypothetical protein
MQEERASSRDRRMMRRKEGRSGNRTSHTLLVDADLHFFIIPFLLGVSLIALIVVLTAVRKRFLFDLFVLRLPVDVDVVARDRSLLDRASSVD